MATKKSIDAKSVSNIETVNIAGDVGKQNPSVSAIKERFDIENQKRIENYAKASEEKVKKILRDIAQSNSSVSSLKPTDKTTIKGYLTGNIYSNSANLINASLYLYYRSPIYAQIIDKYSSMYCWDCRRVDPNYKFVKGLDKNSLKQMDATLDFLDIMCLKNNLQVPITNMWLCDVSYNIWFHDSTGSFFWNIDPSEAIIDSIYETPKGFTYGFAIDMTKWRNKQKQALIEFLGSPLKEMWETYEREGVKYVHVPAEYSFVIKKRIYSMDNIIPPLLPYFMSLASLNDLADTQSTADKLSFYRLVYLPLKTISSSKTTDDWQITPDLAIDYFDIATKDAFPDGISSAVIPGDELKTIDFSDTVSDDVNRVENSQQQILGGMSGMGALINANKAINNTELIKNALRAESAYALQGVLPQVEAWTELQMMLNVNNYCSTTYLPITIYTKEDYRKTLLESNQYGFSFRLAYGTLLGATERQTMANLLFETQVLELQNLMQYPLQSSYTTSNTTEEAGRPEKDSGELSPSGERSRNS